VILQICDDGRGFNLAEVSADHMGLRIMQERAAAIDAILRVESQPGQGAQIELAWPARAVPGSGLAMKGSNYE
jgi:nitrate/nitrite-specific signal transduction histidine kinase